MAFLNNIPWWVFAALGAITAGATNVLVKAGMKGDVRYTMDGTGPTAASAVYTEAIKVDKTATVVAGLFVDGQQVGEAWKQVFNWVAAVKNLTTGKPVTASVTEGGYGPENAVDGVVERDRAWWAGPYPQWLQVDLQAVHKVNKIEVFPFWDGHRYYQYTVSLSLDAKSWTLVADMSKNQNPSTPAGDSLDFKPTPARYIRVGMLKNSANAGVHVVEVRAYESK